MTVEIDDAYIYWLRNGVFRAEDVTEQEADEYVNEVLAQHRASWEETNA